MLTGQDMGRDAPQGCGSAGCRSVPSEKETPSFRMVFLFLEVTPGFEPGNEGFADPCLTTWLCHRTVSPLDSILYAPGFVKRETEFLPAFLSPPSDKALREKRAPRPQDAALRAYFASGRMPSSTSGSAPVLSMP